MSAFAPSINDFGDAVSTARAAGRKLYMRGGGTKDFYGEAVSGEVLDTRAYYGIVSYEPSELVITTRCGTPLREVENLLAEHGQMLAFEPPHFGEHATIGGCVAAGLSGPRRAYAGALRDHVLGTRILDGQGQDLRFGGQVIKNVAGYDVSRLLAGSLGTLALILEISLKTIPKPFAQTTLKLEMPQPEAITRMNRWSGSPLPLSASCHVDGVLWLRLSGARAAVATACRQIGGVEIEEAETFWASVREHTHAFFVDAAIEKHDLWRLSVPSTTPPLDLPGAELVEWSGALRWYKGAADAGEVRGTVNRLGGHATLFKSVHRRAKAFPALAAPLFTLHQRLKKVFDPDAVFDGGRMFPDL